MNNLYVNWFDLYKYKNEFILNKGFSLVVLTPKSWTNNLTY